jgi:hypothetical protein
MLISEVVTMLIQLQGIEFWAMKIEKWVRKRQLM